MDYKDIKRQYDESIEKYKINPNFVLLTEDSIRKLYQSGENKLVSKLKLLIVESYDIEGVARSPMLYHNYQGNKQSKSENNLSKDKIINIIKEARDDAKREMGIPNVYIDMVSDIAIEKINEV